MPRNPSGIYSLPAGNPVVTLTTVSSAWANNTLADIAAALTDSLSAPLLPGNGMVARTSSSTFAARTLTGTSGKVDITNGDGATGNPTFTLPGVIHQEGIKFPATQVASGDANTLDDYEEGTWTPTLTFDTPGDLSVVYSFNTGSYTKIGRQVSLFFSIAATTFTFTTANGSLRIGGCPFVKSGAHEFSGMLWQLVGAFLPADNSPVVGMDGGTQILFRRHDAVAGNSQGIGTAHMTSGGTKIVHGTIIFNV